MKFRREISLVVCAILLALAAIAVPAQASLPPIPRMPSPSASMVYPQVSQSPGQTLRIQVLGDSISAPNADGRCWWCDYLDGYLRRVGVTPVWLDRGLSGADCGYTASNEGAWIAADRPDLILLDCGTNNIPIDTATQQAMTGQLQSIISTVHAAGVPLGMSYIGISNPVNISASGAGLPVAEADANIVISQILAGYPSGYFAGIADFSKMPGDLDYLKDGIHQTVPLGALTMASIWYRALRASMGWPDVVPEPCGMWGYPPGGTPPPYTSCVATA